MKKTLILVFALVALCLLASCNPDKNTTIEKKNIENNISIGAKARTLELNDGKTKKELRLVYGEEGKSYLKIWTKGVEQTEFNKEPDVTYTGTYKYVMYLVLIKDTDSYTEYTRTPCGTIEFTKFEVPEDAIDTVKESYKHQMTLYSGSFDFELVSGYTKNTYEDGSWGKKLDRNTKGAVVNLVVTQHPDKDTNQSYVIGNGWKQI